MKTLFKILSVLVLGISSLSYGQGAQRFANALQPVPGTGTAGSLPFAQIISNAQITVCTYTSVPNSCVTPTTIYSDVALTIPVTQPLSANSFGIYQYFMASGSHVVEKICAPYNQCYYNNSIYLLGGSGGGGGGGTLTSFSAPSVSWPTWLVPAVSNPTTTPVLTVSASAIPFSALATLSANTVLGAVTGTTPSGLSLPSCNGSTDAITYTSGSGFGCHSISTGSTAFSGLTSGSNTSAAMVVGSGATLGWTGSGAIDSTSIQGISVSGTPSVGMSPVATSSSTATWQSIASSGVQYNPSNTLYLWVGPDSIVGDDAGGYVKGSPIPMGAWSISGGVCTFNSTSANNLTIGEWFTPDQVSSFPAVPSPYAAWTAGYDLFQVATTPTTTQWTAACPLLSNTSGTGGNAENANYFLPFYPKPFMDGHGTTDVALPIGSTLASLDTNFATVVTPRITAWQGANPGAPIFVILTGGRNDVSACNSAATIEGHLTSIWAKIQALGAKVFQATLTPNPYNTSNIGCHTAFKTQGDVNAFIEAQAPTNFNTEPNCTTACSKHWDLGLDATPALYDLNDANVNQSGGGLNANSIARYANMVNEVFATQRSAVRGYPNFFQAGVAGGSIAPGFGISFVPRVDSGFAFSFWNAAQNNDFLQIDTSIGRVGFPYLGAQGFLALSSGGWLTSTPGVAALTTTGSNCATATFGSNILNIPPCISGVVSIPNGTPTYTAGTNVTSVACASTFTCTNSRGELTIVGGTATTGVIATVNFSATLGGVPFCTVIQQGGTTVFGLSHSLPSTSSFTISAAVSVASSTITIDYQCQQ